MISTTQEAIDEIRCDMCIRHEEMTDDLYEALDMAIDALTAQEQLANDSPELDNNFGDLISRRAALDAIFSEPLYKSGMKKRDVDVVVPAIYEKIKSLPSAQPETHDKRTETHACDLISRQAAIDAEG